MKKIKREPKRLMRQIEKITAKYVRMHPALWGLSKEDLFNRAFEAVWKSGAKTPEQARIAIYSALSKCRDESKHNRSCLEPYQVRKAEKKVLEGVNTGNNADDARQIAFREFLEDYDLLSQRASFREVDRKRVEITIKRLEQKYQEIAKRFLELGSIKAVARSYGVAPRTYLRREWTEFKKQFIAVWETVDEERLARKYCSNPNIIAGRCICLCRED